MDRETKTIKLSDGTEVSIYSYMITREMFAMKDLSNKEVSEYSIKTFIVKIGDVEEKEKIYEIVMNMKIVDYREIDKALAELLEPIFDKKK